MSYIDLCESIQINLNKLYDTYEEVVDEFVFNKKPATVFVKDYILLLHHKKNALYIYRQTQGSDRKKIDTQIHISWEWILCLECHAY